MWTARRSLIRAFQPGLKPLVRAVHVAEVRLAADLGNDFAVDDGRLAGDARPGTVGVPGERSLVRMPAVGLAVLVEIRKPVELGVAIGVILVHHVNLHFAEMPCKRDLRARRHVLWRKQQDLVAQERPVDPLEQFVRNAVRELYPLDLGAEIRRERAHGKGQSKIGGGVHGSE